MASSSSRGRKAAPASRKAEKAAPSPVVEAAPPAASPVVETASGLVVVPSVVPPTAVAAATAVSSRPSRPERGIRGLPGGVYGFLDTALVRVGRPVTEAEFVEFVKADLLARRPDYNVAARVELYFRDADYRATLGRPSRTPRKPRGRTGGTVYGPRRPDGEVTLVYDPAATVVVVPPEIGAGGVEAVVSTQAAAPVVEKAAPVVEAVPSRVASRSEKAAATLAREAEKAARALARDAAERDARKAARSRKAAD